MRKKNRRHPLARRHWLGDVDALERYWQATERPTHEEIDNYLSRKLATTRRFEPEDVGPDWPDSEAT